MSVQRFRWAIRILGVRWAAVESSGAHSGAGREEEGKDNILGRNRICGQVRLAKLRPDLSAYSCRCEAREALLFSPGRRAGTTRGSGPSCPGLWWLRSLTILGCRADRLRALGTREARLQLPSCGDCAASARGRGVGAGPEQSRIGGVELRRDAASAVFEEVLPFSGRNSSGHLRGAPFLLPTCSCLSRSPARPTVGDSPGQPPPRAPQSSADAIRRSQEDGL